MRHPRDRAPSRCEPSRRIDACRFVFLPSVPGREAAHLDWRRVAGVFASPMACALSQTVADLVGKRGLSGECGLNGFNRDHDQATQSATGALARASEPRTAALPRNSERNGARRGRILKIPRTLLVEPRRGSEPGRISIIRSPAGAARVESLKGHHDDLSRSNCSHSTFHVQSLGPSGGGRGESRDD